MSQHEVKDVTVDIGRAGKGKDHQQVAAIISVAAAEKILRVDVHENVWGRQQEEEKRWAWDGAGRRHRKRRWKWQEEAKEISSRHTSVQAPALQI